MHDLSSTAGIVALAAAGVALVSLILAVVAVVRLRRLRADQRVVLGEKERRASSNAIDVDCCPDISL